MYILTRLQRISWLIRVDDAGGGGGGGGGGGWGVKKDS